LLAGRLPGCTLALSVPSLTRGPRLPTGASGPGSRWSTSPAGRAGKRPQALARIVGLYRVPQLLLVESSLRLLAARRSDCGWTSGGPQRSLEHWANSKDSARGMGPQLRCSSPACECLGRPRADQRLVLEDADQRAAAGFTAAAQSRRSGPELAKDLMPCGRSCLWDGATGGEAGSHAAAWQGGGKAEAHGGAETCVPCSGVFLRTPFSRHADWGWYGNRCLSGGHRLGLNCNRCTPAP
jgi:hypothetical protein